MHILETVCDFVSRWKDLLLDLIRSASLWWSQQTAWQWVRVNNYTAHRKHLRSRLMYCLRSVKQLPVVLEAASALFYSHFLIYIHALAPKPNARRRSAMERAPGSCCRLIQRGGRGPGQSGARATSSGHSSSRLLPKVRALFIHWAPRRSRFLL